MICDGCKNEIGVIPIIEALGQKYCIHIWKRLNKRKNCERIYNEAEQKCNKKDSKSADGNP